MGDLYQISENEILIVERRGKDYSKNAPILIMKKKEKQ